MLSLPGAPALSPFRIAKLLGLLRARQAAVTGLTSRFVHFVDAERALDASESTVLQQLLTYGPRPGADAVPGDSGDLVIVVPRAGTISSWSSKATDIAQVCGLNAVRRVERGIAYRVQSSRALTRAELAALAGVLFDRMTEMVLFDEASAAQLFEHAQPKKLARVSLTEGRESISFFADAELDATIPSSTCAEMSVSCI